jgi:hypothetical protein
MLWRALLAFHLTVVADVPISPSLCSDQSRVKTPRSHLETSYAALARLARFKAVKINPVCTTEDDHRPL